MNASNGADAAALQWTLQYPATAVVASNAAAGPAAISAGKEITCVNRAGSATCILVGLNANSITDGLVANILVQLSPTASGKSIPITMSDAVAASTDGDAINTTATDGTIAITPVITHSLSCAPETIVMLGSTTCTVTLSHAAPSPGVTVSLSDNSASLTLPASVTIPAGITSASFTATAMAVTVNTTVQITAARNGISDSVPLMITPLPPLTHSLNCTPASIITPGIATCAVTLSRAATSPGVSVSLSDNSGSISLPASVTVPNGGTSVSFTANAQAVEADKMVQITATRTGISASAWVTLTPPALTHSLSCTPASIATPGVTTCTVTLSRLPGSQNVAVWLSDNSGSVTLPASVTIQTGSTSRSFTAIAAEVKTNTTVRITATRNGISSSADVKLTPPPAGIMHSLKCTPPVIATPALGTCTVTLSKAAPAPGVTVSLADNSASFFLPPFAIVPTGSTSTSFTVAAAAVTANITIQATATRNGISSTESITLTRPQLTHSLSCVPVIVTPGSAVCSVILSQAAPAAGLTVLLSDNSESVTVPAAATIPNGRTAVYFTVASAAVSANRTVQVTASRNGLSSSALVTLTPRSNH